MSIKEFTPSSNFARIYQAFKSAPTTRPLKRRKRSKEDKYFFLDIDIDRKRSRVHAQDEKKESLNDGISERLKKAEQEAEQLRKQLAEAKALQAERDGSNQGTESPKKKASRIDGTGLQRETLFTSNPVDWLSESAFMKGTSGPGEVVDNFTSSPEEAATIKRRLLIGIGLTVLIAGLSLVPTDSFRLIRPSKPLFFYLVPLVRVQDLLSDLEKAAVDGETTEVEQGILRIQGAPNFAIENLRNAAAALPDSKSAEKARVAARDVIEYLDSIDFNKYFENLQKPSSRSGEAQRVFLEFSLNSIRAAQNFIMVLLHTIFLPLSSKILQIKLRTFFGLMPPDQMEAAIQQVRAI